MHSTSTYNSRDLIVRSDTKKKKSFSEVLDSKLPFTFPTNSICIECIEGMQNFDFWKITATHEKIVAYLPNKYTSIYLYSLMGAHFYSRILFPFFICCNIIIALVGSAPLWEELKKALFSTYILLGGLCLSILLIIIFKLQERGYILLPHIGFKKNFELNRKNGTVTRFENNKKLYTTLFTDCDCHLRPNMTRNGITMYSLHLIPISNDSTKDITLSNLFNGDYSNKNIYLRLWNTVQWYMDTSRPLPDLPILEAYRSQDKLTIQHDIKNNRTQIFWEKLSYEEYTEYVAELKNKQESIAPLGSPLEIRYTSGKNI